MSSAKRKHDGGAAEAGEGKRAKVTAAEAARRAALTIEQRITEDFVALESACHHNTGEQRGSLCVADFGMVCTCLCTGAHEDAEIEYAPPNQFTLSSLLLLRVRSFEVDSLQALLDHLFVPVVADVANGITGVAAKHVQQSATCTQLNQTLTEVTFSLADPPTALVGSGQMLYLLARKVLAKPDGESSEDEDEDEDVETKSAPAKVGMERHTDAFLQKVINIIAHREDYPLLVQSGKTAEVHWCFAGQLHKLVKPDLLVRRLAFNMQLVLAVIGGGSKRHEPRNKTSGEVLAQLFANALAGAWDNSIR